MINMRLWELDMHHPRAAGAEFLNYSRFGNLNLAEEKLYRLLDIFRFSTCSDVLNCLEKTPQEKT